MIEIFNNKKILMISMIMTLVMFFIVMFFTDPAIDGSNGLSVIALQLAFHKSAAIEIINGWGPSGIEHFNQWIFTDYIYAMSYSVFFASLLSLLIANKGVRDNLRYTWVVYFALAAGLLDCTENTMELYFLRSPSTYPDMLFSLHSFVASAKWSALPVVITYIVVLTVKKGNSEEEKQC